MTAAPPSPHAEAEEQFVAGAETRIRRCFAGLAVIAIVASLLVWHWAVAAGFALGAVVAFISMAHLQRVVQAFTAHAGEAKEPAAATVMRFLMRFALVTLLAYAIFRVSRLAMYSYVAALFLPVAAMSCEAAYEAWFAVRRR